MVNLVNFMFVSVSTIIVNKEKYINAFW